MKLVIFALRRSGSTIFWKTLRQNTGATCFDEPFNPRLSILPSEHKKNVYKEYISLIDKEPEKFWNSLATISPIEENHEKLTDKQRSYLHYLLSSDQDIIIDTTRCWNKMHDIKQVLSEYNAYVLHLYRDPIAFVSSHLLPSEITNWRLKYFLKKSFFTKTSEYNYWNLEDVIGVQQNSAFDALVLKKVSCNSKLFYQAPAYVKLYKFWDYCFNKMEEEGKIIYGDKFLSVSFEKFCQDPIAVLKYIEDKVGLTIKKEKIHVYPANLGYKLTDSHWQHAREFLL